jgi:hypothetical protein
MQYQYHSHTVDEETETYDTTVVQKPHFEKYWVNGKAKLLQQQQIKEPQK